MVAAVIFQQRGAQRSLIDFDTLALRFSSNNQWRDAMWECVTDRCVTRYPVEPVEEISALAGFFEVSITDGQGQCAGPFSIQAAVCNYPTHCFCFLFRADHEGMWSGHTVARSLGKIAVMPYRFDPS